MVKNIYAEVLGHKDNQCLIYFSIQIDLMIYKPHKKGSPQ